MGRIAKLLSFLRVIRNDSNIVDVQVNPSGGDNITAEHFADSGDDSHPLDTDYVAIFNIKRSGGAVAVGYIDPKTTKKSLVGEKRIYSRDSSGETIAEVWLKNDGSILLSNSNGNIELKENGNIDFNGKTVTINASTKFIVNSPKSEFSDIVNVLGLLSAFSYSGLAGSTMSTNVNLETSADVVANGISLTGHNHGGVQVGSGNTGVAQ